MNDYDTETVRRICDNQRGTYIEIGPDGDGLGLIEVRTSGKSAEHYGEIRLVIPTVMARLLSYALVRCSEELDADDLDARVTP